LDWAERSVGDQTYRERRNAATIEAEADLEA
jgi:hypothetical protein